MVTPPSSPYSTPALSSPPPSAPGRTPRLEELLAEVPWIRALSRHLVRDPDLADELVQETLIRASTEGPREAASLRAWLAQVLRNFARAARRSSGRRRLHERSAAKRESLPSTHEVVERAALQRELVQCVLELDEPYRTTLLLCFYESQRPRQIARALGIPAATVRTRLARGLALLRARLDRRHGGDRSAWAWIALPFRPAPTSLFAPLTSLAAMNLKAALSLCALCAVGVAWFVATEWQPTGPLAQELAAAATPSSGDVQSPLPSAQSPGEPRSLPNGAAAAAAPTVAAPIEPAEALVQGRVLDTESRAVAGVAIRMLPADGGESTTVATSDRNGGFALPRPGHPTRASRLEVADERWATVFAGLLGTQADQRSCTIVVAPSAALTGLVVDDTGTPLAEADLAIQPQFSLRTRFAENLDASEDATLRARTDSAGRFEFGRLPRCEGLRVTAELGGHVPFSAPLVGTDWPFKTITLTRLANADGVLRGRVLDEGDLPVPGAIVALGLETTVSDEHGAFAIEKAGAVRRSLAGDPVELRALAPGRLPASFRPPLESGEPRWPEFVTLRLGGRPLSISGRVLRADGTPLHGARVWLDDTTTFGEGPSGTLQTEGWLAGDTQNAWHYATSDEDGAFRLEGLLDREYRLCALDGATLERESLERVAAGRHDVTLRFAPEKSWATLEGTVVDSAGAPLGAVRVVPHAMGFMARHAGRNLFSTSMSLDGVVTDADGRFRLERVPREGVTLNFSGDHVLDRGIDVASAVLDQTLHEAPAEPRSDGAPRLRIVLERRMQLQVELADASLADCFALLDERGEELTILLRTGTTTYFMTRPPILEGHSHVASVGEGARTVVFYKEKAEVARAPVRLTPGEINVIRR